MRTTTYRLARSKAMIMQGDKISTMYLLLMTYVWRRSGSLASKHRLIGSRSLDWRGPVLCFKKFYWSNAFFRLTSELWESIFKSVWYNKLCNGQWALMLYGTRLYKARVYNVNKRYISQNISWHNIYKLSINFHWWIQIGILVCSNSGSRVYNLPWPQNDNFIHLTGNYIPEHINWCEIDALFLFRKS